MPPLKIPKQGERRTSPAAAAGGGGGDGPDKEVWAAKKI